MLKDVERIYNSILRYHRKNTDFHLERIKEDVNALEKEKERLSIDLHDDLGASLSSIKLHLQGLYKPGDENFKKIQNIELQVDELMERMKDVAHGFMPRVLMRRGLDKALQLLIARISDSSGIRIQYSCRWSILIRKTLCIYTGLPRKYSTM